MEELQRIIHITLNPQQNYSPEIRLQTQAQCDKIILDHAQDFAFFFNIIRSASDSYVKFWAIGVIGQIVERFYSSYPLLLKESLHKMYFDVINECPISIFSDSFIENRYALLFITILKVDFPFEWENAFEMLFKITSNQIASKDFTVKIKFIGFILSVLMEFNREIIEFDEGKSSEDFKRIREIKSKLNDGTIAEIYYFIDDILNNASTLIANSAIYIITKSLEILERIISWTSIDISITKIPILIKFIEKKKFQVHSLKCLNEIIKKGMEPINKLKIIEDYHLLELVKNINANGDEECFKAISSFINRLGLFYLTCLHKNCKLEPDIQTNVRTTFFNILQLGYQCLDSEFHEVSIGVIEFLNQYISSLKETEFRPIHKESIGPLIEILLRRMQNPDLYEDYDEDDKSLMYYRNELSSIIANMLLVPSIRPDIIDYIGKLVNCLKFQYLEVPLSQREVVLYIFFRIGEQLKGKKLNKEIEMAAELRKGTMSQVMGLMMSIPQLFSDKEVIVCLVMNIISRYALYFELHEAEDRKSVV